MPLDEAGWSALRGEWEFGRGLIPMNAANMCPPPRVVREAVAGITRAVDLDVSFQHRIRYNARREGVRARVARFLDAATEEIALVRNASEGNAILIQGLDLGPGDEVLLVDQNHASNGLAWHTRASRAGFQVREVSLPSPAGREELLAALTAPVSAATRVIAVSDISNGSGLALPVEALCRFGRERGIHVHLDGAQSMGARRVSLKTLGCGSYAASTQKWLMGPRDAGVLFVRRDRIPAIWPSVVSRGFTDSEEPDPATARKLDALGQRDDGVLAGVEAAIVFLEAIGLEAIEARVRALVDRLARGLEGLRGFHFVTPRDPELSHGVLVGRFEGLDHAALCDRLYQRHGIAAAPTGGLRLSPHIYNSPDDVEVVLKAIAAAVG